MDNLPTHEPVSNRHFEVIAGSTKANHGRSWDAIDFAVKLLGQGSIGCGDGAKMNIATGLLDTGYALIGYTLEGADITIEVKG